MPTLGGISGTVGPDGGTVSRLYFAVVGDTRPAVIDDTGHYPSAVINHIFQEINALDGVVLERAVIDFVERRVVGLSGRV